MTPYYDDGQGIVISHGDCRAILPQLTYDVILTDPPYGKGLAYGDERVDTHAGFLELAAWLPSLGKPAVFTIPSTKLYDVPRPQWVGVWHTPMSMGFWSTPLLPHWEPILFYNLPPGKLGTSDVWTHNTAKPNGHPAPKPMAFWCELLAALPPGVVCDPFLGSGTTLVAAKRLGRPAIGIEIEERYCALSVDRLRQTVMRLEATV